MVPEVVSSDLTRFVSFRLVSFDEMSPETKKTQLRVSFLMLMILTFDAYDFFVLTIILNAQGSFGSKRL